MDIPDCRAISYGGIPTIELLHKLEETDMSHEEYGDQLEASAYATDNFMRHAITDRNADAPFLDGDAPTNNITAASGKLNARYNGNRGSTEYQPDHSEQLIGQDLEVEDWSIYPARMKQHAATRADQRALTMGNNSDEHTAENVWSDPAVSFAKQEINQRFKHTYNTWEYPQYLNFQRQETRFRDPSKTARERHEVMRMEESGGPDTGPELRDEYAKYFQPRFVGSQYMTPYTSQTMSFGSESMNDQMRAINEMDPAKARLNASDWLFNYDSNKNRNRAKGLARTMKSIVKTQQQTATMGDAMYTQTRGAPNIKQLQSEITRVLTSQTSGDNIESRQTDRGLGMTRDYGKTSRQTIANIPQHVLSSMHTMVKASKGHMDPGRAKYNIQLAKLQNEEVMRNRAAAKDQSLHPLRESVPGSILMDGANGMAYSGRPDVDPDSRAANVTLSEEQPDTELSHTRSATRLPEWMHSQKTVVEHDKDTFSVERREVWSI
jgi:hypothetical protein